MDAGEIYLITNKINFKKYIGQAVSISSNGKKRGSIKRWKEHVKRARNNVNECRRLENAIRKYGSENFDLEILLTCNIDKLNYYESLFMQLYNSVCPNGYNLRIESVNGRKHCEKTKEMMSITRTGKTHSEITKQRIGNAHLNRIVSEESRNKLSCSTKFIKMKEDNRQNLLNRLKELEIDKLPMYIYYNVDKRYKNKLVDGLIVRKPGIDKLKLLSQKLSFKEKLELAVQYLNSKVVERFP